MEKTVEAVICGHEITSAEVDAFIASLPREQQVYASHPDFRKQCVDQLIAVYALAKYGEEEKLDETEKFKAILENARKDILAQMAIGKIFEGITISDEEVREYFEANKARFAKGASVHAKHILVDSEDKCNELLESIVSGGKAFEDVAKESSTCPVRSKRWRSWRIRKRTDGQRIRRCRICSRNRTCGWTGQDTVWIPSDQSGR